MGALQEAQTRNEMLQAQQVERVAPPARQMAFQPLIDTRLLAKPKSFFGCEADWDVFATIIRAYC
eukprot:426155-Amphidinium_carterae.1